MAGIDKTYFNTWEQYKEVHDWAVSVGTVTDDYGNVFTPYNFMCQYESKEEFDDEVRQRIDYARTVYGTEEYKQQMRENYPDWEFDKDYCPEFVLWNTPVYFDIWLIRYCPVEWIQDRLKEQYGGGWSKTAFTHGAESMYQSIKNRTSDYDKYERNGTRGNLKFTMPQTAKFKDNDIWWWIDVDDMWYNDETDEWWHHNEPHPAYTNVAHKHGNISKRKLARILNKWNLPDGTVVRFSGLWHRYEMKKFTITVHKRKKDAKKS